MSRRLEQAAIAFVVVFVAAQFIRPDRANPPTDFNRTIQAHLGTGNGLTAIVDRSCADCHSNGTAWPLYTRIAPVSWLMALAVTEGRRVLNFSEWGTYSPDQRRALLVASCADASAGKMPGSPYTLLHPEARLSAQDVETICRATDSDPALVVGDSR
jgi:hypothetical protein